MSKKSNKQKRDELPGKHPESDDEVIKEYYELKQQDVDNAPNPFSRFIAKHTIKKELING